MISEVQSDLFELRVDALAHGCNTQGVMNAGIALEFKQRYPQMYQEYIRYCKTGLFNPGDIHFYRSEDSKPHVINIATQLDRRTPAQLSYIERGFNNIESNYKAWGISSLGMPHIGCGLGGLDWQDVSKVVKKVFGTSRLDVLVASR